MELTKQQREARAELARLLKEQQTESDVAVVVNEEVLAWLEAGHDIIIGHTSGYVSLRTTANGPIALYIHPRKLSVALSGDDEATEVIKDVKGAKTVRKGSNAASTIYAELISAIVRRPAVRTLVRAALQREAESSQNIFLTAQHD